MSDLTTTVQRVLDLDKQATPGPWTPQMMEGIDGDTLSAAGPEHAITDDENDDERDNSSDAALADARLIAEYRTAAPVLARAVTALEAKLAAAVARGCCDACAGAGGDPDCMCGGSGSAADAVVHLRNEYFAARAELQAAVARAEAAEEACREADPGLACASCGARSATGTTFTSVAQEMGDEDIECGACGSVDTGEVGPVLSRLSSDVDTLRSERDALRADLARVTASEASARQERDRIEEAALHNVREAFAQTTTARQEAEGLRARLTALDKHTFDQDDDNAPLYVLRDEMLAALSSPAPVPATPVSAIHNVGKPCPVCSGCDVCLGTGRAPHYVPAPVPATPAPDALALLREARHALDSAWSLRPSVDVELVPTAFRPLSVRTLFAKIDAALAGRA